MSKIKYLGDLRWNGLGGPETQEAWSIPHRRKAPSVFLVDDLFQEGTEFSLAWDAQRIMAQCPRHKFLLATTNPGRMLEFCEWVLAEARSWAPVAEIGTFVEKYSFPVNVYPTLVVCGQQEVDEKLPAFFRVPGCKILKIEGQNEEIDLWEAHGGFDQALKVEPHVFGVILGGKSGGGALPIHPDWVRSARDQCAVAETPFYFDQWGDWMHESHNDFESSPGAALSNRNAMYNTWPDGTRSFRVGRDRAGRDLDGRVHGGLP